MRIAMPPLKERRAIRLALSDFYHGHEPSNFNRAVGIICRFYKLKRPKVEWFEYIDRGKTWGLTHEHGELNLIHPEHWKASEAEWIRTIGHEFGHYVLWADCERKADLFAAQMERGL